MTLTNGEKATLGRNGVKYPLIINGVGYSLFVGGVSDLAVPTYADLLLISGTEGERALLLDTGARYTYSATLGYWIRKEAYDVKDGTIELLGEAPGTDTSRPGLNLTVYNGGSFTSNGTYGILDGWTTFNTRTTLDVSSPPALDSVILMQGHFTAQEISATSTSHYSFSLEYLDGTKRNNLYPDIYSLSHHARLGYLTTYIGTVVRNVAFYQTFHFVEHLCIPGVGEYVYFDNEATPSLWANYSAINSYVSGTAVITLTAGNPSSGRESLVHFKNYKVFKIAN